MDRGFLQYCSTVPDDLGQFFGLVAVCTIAPL